MKIVAGPASEQLAKKIAELSDLETVPLSCRTYPDGEFYVRLEAPLDGEEVSIVQTTSPPQDTRILQLALIADAARRAHAKKITAVVPYLAYARQDKMFLQGEAISIETVARMLKAAGVDSLLTVNVHEEKVLRRFPFPARMVSAVPLLSNYFKRKDVQNVFALAPDDGSKWLVEEAKTILGGESGYLEKQRDPHTGQLTMKEKSLNVKGKTVVIFDDVISTGGTVTQAAKAMFDDGASAVYVACVHPLLVGDAAKRILETGVTEIVGTDSVASNVSRVSLAPLLSKEIGKGA